jgi:hypothetical protein
MTNLNLIKLIIGMQLELRTMIHKATDMENALNEIMAGVEREREPKPPNAVPKLTAEPSKRYGTRQSPAYRLKMSKMMKARWAKKKANSASNHA